MNTTTEQSEKLARDFACKYLCGFMNVTVNQFEEAKLEQHNSKVADWVITNFNKNIKNYDSLDGVYHLTDLLEAWEEAKRFLPLSDFK